MEVSVAESVCTIQAKVANLIGPSRFRTWFGGATQFELNGQRLDVLVANSFIGNWISSNFMAQLVEAARDVIDGDPRVQVHVNDALKAKASETVAVADRPASAARLDGPGRPGSPPRPEGRPKLRGELDSYVVGPSNELAFSVASSVARAPGHAFKHVVLHSGCGLGKTHLLQAICNGVNRSHPTWQWSYLSGEEFTNEFIYAVKSNHVDQFRARFRNIDLLVIDDIHFLANKQATQSEFLHTFNAIDASGKAVVLSCDCHPRAIATLSEPLINRLVAAMVVRIDPPDFATRREILRRRAADMAYVPPPEVLDFVARNVTRNVRELEGALYKLVAYASLTKEPLRLDLARRAIEDYVVAAQPPEAHEIERLAAAHFGVTREAIRSGSRDRTVTQARGVTMYLIRKHTRLSFPEIGRLLGDKQHSTVLMAVRRVQELLDHDERLVWKTPAGLREASARSLLDELEQHLARGHDAAH